MSKDQDQVWRDRDASASRIAAFDKEIEQGLQASQEATEQEKLEQIFWASRQHIDGHTVPGAVVLAAIERHVAYDGLPEEQRAMLKDVRANVNARQSEVPEPGQKDVVGIALGRIVDTGHFEQLLGYAKNSVDEPWAKVPEAEKVRRIVDLALQAEPYPDISDTMGPPGRFVLETIEREVDFGKLSPRWREALEGVRGQLDREEPSSAIGITSEGGDRAELTLRMATLKATIDDYKEFGDTVKRPVHLPWKELTEDEKLDPIKYEIRHLRLNGEPGAVDVIARDVDLTKVAYWDRQSFANERQKAWGEWSQSDRGADAEEKNPWQPHEDTKPAEAGRYEVWHDRGWPQSRINQMLGGWPPSQFPEDYFHAASVQAESLQDAVALTTSKGDVLSGNHQPWDGNPGVRSYTPKPFVPRDTDAGDVIVDPEGKPHRYERDGFSEIKAPDASKSYDQMLADAAGKGNPRRSPEQEMER